MRDLLRVVEPGLLTTVQDLGRPGAMASGVPPGGAADRFAHRAANALVGNAANDATLECTMAGPQLLAESSCLVAIAGGDLGPAVNGRDAPMWTSFLLAAGDHLSFAGRRSGVRAYISVAGGFEGERWLGSRSTSLIATRGGLAGRALVAGDLLSAAAEGTAPQVAGRFLPSDLRVDYAARTLRAMPGPHFRRLDAEGRRLLYSAAFTVTHEADRMGCRLDGPALTPSGEELLSFGLVAGAVQAIPSGRLILLLADHQTAGGYPVVAVVVSASLPVAAQLAPGDQVRLVQATALQARAQRAQHQQALATLSVP